LTNKKKLKKMIKIILIIKILMGNFAIVLDNMFDEIMSKHKKNKVLLEDLVNIKSCLKIAYYNDNKESNNFIRLYLNEIDFKI
jgi:hypothetical protein